jgi:hypothetical protein
MGPKIVHLRAAERRLRRTAFAGSMSEGWGWAAQDRTQYVESGFSRTLVGGST